MRYWANFHVYGGPATGAPVVVPEKEEDVGVPGGKGGWIVTVFDNDYNTWEEVMYILQVATGCGPEEAYTETWEIHHLGRSVVHCAGREECENVAAIIATIGIKVAVSEG